MKTTTAFNLSDFITNPSADIEDINIAEVLMYKTFNKDLDELWVLDIDLDLVLAYDDYTVSLCLLATNRLPVAGNEDLTVEQMIDAQGLQFALQDEQKRSDVIIKVKGDKSKIKGLASFWGVSEGESIFYIEDTELREEVLIAYKEGLNPNPVFSNHKLDEQLTSSIFKLLRELAKQK